MGVSLRSLIDVIRKKPSQAPDDQTEEVAKHTSIVSDVAGLGLKNAAKVAGALVTLASGEPLNDKDLLLENGINMLQHLPASSGLAATISDQFINMLWNNLPHPPPTMAGPGPRYRRHDGGNNNPWSPEMGKAGSSYARGVPPTKAKSPNLPDPLLVFDQLLLRKGPFREHPSGLNRLFFSFATIVIHECFQTNREKPWINDTSSYVDLSTLYGNSEKEQPRVRTYKMGTIYPDSIASDRIMMMPPGVVAVLLLFSRNHNHIAQNLYTVNEQGKYKAWAKLSDEEKKWQDEDIFQLARNINVGFFATVVLKDYVAAILNTPRANSEFSLDLGAEIKSFGKRVERGTGNVVSVEFAVLYHWHAALSAADDRWMKSIICEYLPGSESLDDMSLDMFKEVMMLYGQSFKDTLPHLWTFGGLLRGTDGRFSDVDLADLIKDCIEEPAHAFGAHGTPASLKVVDLMGQIQARDHFNVATLNEFRKYLNLKTYKTFEEWNSDKTTARAAELLYGHIDNLELYPGLMAECTKPSMPGSGVCPGQTTGRGILDDAVALVRGDRFLSYDYNSTTLTNWGFAKLGVAQQGAYGGRLPYLLFNGLPGAFTGTSSYALLPFYTPTAVKGILEDNKVIGKYDLERSGSDRGLVGIHTNAACKAVFEDRENFRVIYQAAILQCTNGHEFMIGWDDAHRHDPRSALLHKIFEEDNFEANLSAFFESNIRRLVKEKSLKYFNSSRRSLDVVRDVCNVVPILWLADRFAIPLKTVQHPKGLVALPDLFKTFLVLFMYQSFNIIPGNEWKLREGAMTAAPILRNIFEAHLKTQHGGKEVIVDWLAEGSAYEVNPQADRLYHALNDSKLPLADLVGDCIGISAPVAGNITQQASILIDLFLQPDYATYKARIIELAHMDRAESERELQGFVYEGMRHAGVVPGLPRVANRDITVMDGVRGPVYIKKDQTILIATSSAAMDPVAFPEPDKLNPHRPFKDYTLLGHGLHFCFGARLVGCSLATILREVFRLKNVRRANGRQGMFHIVYHEFAGVKMRQYLDSNCKESPIPTTLTIEYDDA